MRNIWWLADCGQHPNSAAKAVEPLATVDDEERGARTPRFVYVGKDGIDSPGESGTEDHGGGCLPFLAAGHSSLLSRLARAQGRAWPPAKLR